MQLAGGQVAKDLLYVKFAMQRTTVFRSYGLCLQYHIPAHNIIQSFCKIRKRGK